MAIQSFKLGRSEDYLEGLGTGYSDGLMSGITAAIYLLKRHQYDDDVTTEDMIEVLEGFLNKIKEKRNNKINEKKE